MSPWRETIADDKRITMETSVSWCPLAHAYDSLLHCKI